MKIEYTSRVIKLLLLGAALAILSVACTDQQLDPIFYTLEQETPLVDAGLSNELMVHRVVKGVTNYYAAAGQVFYRAIGSTDWHKAAPPVSGALCNNVAYFASNLYGGFFNPDGTSLGLRYATNPASFNWAAETTGGTYVDNEQIIMLKVVNALLFVTTLDANGYTLHYYTDAVTFNTTNLTSLSEMIDDITHDGTNYWVIAGPELYSAAILSALTLQNPPPSEPKTTKPFGGVFYSSTNATTYLSSKDGNLFSYFGGSWSSASVNDSPSFTEFADLANADKDVVVGSEEKGYYLLPGGLISDAVRKPDYNIADLYNAVVLSFLVDGSKLFAGTARAGLWRSDDSGATWSRE